MVDALVDKAKFQAYAEEIGLRVPRAVVLDRGHDEQALDALSMPVVLKPADKALVLAGMVERATRADTLAEARAVARRMRRAASSVVVQEWIDGNDDDIYFTLFVCDGQARIVALFTGRKMICAPPLVGTTALCVAATEEHQALAAQTQAFVTHSHHHGIGLEFKRHRRTGEFVVVEPTVGRTDWQEEIATLCGVNIPAIAHQTALGEPIESVAQAQLDRVHAQPVGEIVHAGLERKHSGDRAGSPHVRRQIDVQRHNAIRRTHVGHAVEEPRIADQPILIGAVFGCLGAPLVDHGDDVSGLVCPDGHPLPGW